MKTRNWDNICASVYGFGEWTTGKTTPTNKLYIPNATIRDQFGGSIPTNEIVTPEYSENGPIWLQSIYGNLIPIVHDLTIVANRLTNIHHLYATTLRSETVLYNYLSSDLYKMLLIFGTGSLSADEIYNAYTLDSKIDDADVISKIQQIVPISGSYTPEVNVTYNSSTHTYTRRFVFNFSALDDFTFSEVGLCASPSPRSVGLYTAVYNANTPSHMAWGTGPAPIMIDYKLLDAPVTVHNGDTFSISFEQSFTSLYAPEPEAPTSDEGQDTGGRGTQAVEITIEQQEQQIEDTTQYEEDEGYTFTTPQEQIVAYAISKVGYKYSQQYRDSGATDPDGYFDCSSLAYYSCQAAGIDISYGGAYSAAAEAQGLNAKGKFYQTGNPSNIRPGDLVFYAFKNSNGQWTQPDRWLHISHVAIYTGVSEDWQQTITHARNTKVGVCQNDFTTYGRANIVGYGRPW